MMKNLLGEDATRALREIGELSQALGKSKRIAEGSQTAFIGKAQAIILSVLHGRIDLAAKIAGADTVLSKIFSSEIGRKWLTEGLTAPTVLQKLGGIAIPAASRGISAGVTSEISNP